MVNDIVAGPLQMQMHKDIAFVIARHADTLRFRHGAIRLADRPSPPSIATFLQIAAVDDGISGLELWRCGYRYRYPHLPGRTVSGRACNGGE